MRLEAADPKAEPSLQPLAIVRSVDLICHLWQQYVNTALLPLASSSVTIRREMVVFNSQSVSRLEGAANQLLQRVTDCMHSLYSIIILINCIFIQRSFLGYPPNSRSKSVTISTRETTTYHLLV
jgi:hypothetical protein